MTDRSGFAGNLRVNSTEEKPGEEAEMKKRPFSMFSRIKNYFGQMEASAEQKEMGNVRQKKKIFCALKTPELPSEAVLQRTDFTLI